MPNRVQKGADFMFKNEKFFDLQRFASIINSNSNSIISGTSSNDTIQNGSYEEYNANSVTINAGAGNDSMYVSFIDRIHTSNCKFICSDFRQIDTTIFNKNDFVYADPPYLITCAAYNDEVLVVNCDIEQGR